MLAMVLSLCSFALAADDSCLWLWAAGIGGSTPSCTTAARTLQYLLKMKLAISMQSANAANATAGVIAKSTKSTPIIIRCAVTVVYPFRQRYFVTDMVLGSVKR